MHRDPNRLALLRQRLASIEQAINLLAEAYAAPVATHGGQDEEAMSRELDALLASCLYRARQDLQDAEKYHLGPSRGDVGRVVEAEAA